MRRVAAALLLCLGAGTAQAGDGPRVPTLRWAPCAEAPGFECATARVPLDNDEPDGALTRIALARLPASDRARRIGTLFLNPGGPGGSGVDLGFRLCGVHVGTPAWAL